MNQKYDLIVVGSGAAGLTAACVAAAQGSSVLLLEQSAHVGGTTAISGGMVWIPDNHKMAGAGRTDSPQAVRAYLAHTVGSTAPERLEAYLAQGDEALRFLEAHTALRMRPVATYPDYYPDLPGATLGGRVLEPEPYDARTLGKRFTLLRDPLPEFMLWGGMMVSRQDLPHLRRATRSLRSALYVGRLLLRHGLQRLRAHRGTTLFLGNALAGRLLQSALDLGVDIRTRATVLELLRDDGRVQGVRASLDAGAAQVLRARQGVVLATGGLSHDAALRSRYVPAHAGTLSATVDPGRAPRGARLAQAIGGTLSPPTEQGAFWVPASTFTRCDGSRGIFPHTVTDRAKPGLIAVDQGGQRFVNEAVSYHEFVRAQLARGSAATPAFLLCDRRFLWKYGLGRVRPFALGLSADLATGYLRRADSIAGLAVALGLPADALKATVEAFNRDAREGRDPTFGRGTNAYQRHLGDADHSPNPCVAPIESMPFYAVAVYPADLGMSCGIATDTHARVLAADGQPVPGLYACGNDMASVMEGAYPGPGITLGPAITFGYIAARHASAAQTV